LAEAVVATNPSAIAPRTNTPAAASVLPRRHVLLDLTTPSSVAVFVDVQDVRDD
jgi:hypothetical protein